jgi:hypothetical protein
VSLSLVVRGGASAISLTYPPSDSAPGAGLPAEFFSRLLAMNVLALSRPDPLILEQIWDVSTQISKKGTNIKQ